MEYVAKTENIDVEKLRKNIASGKEDKKCT